MNGHGRALPEEGFLFGELLPIAPEGGTPGTDGADFLVGFLVDAERGPGGEEAVGLDVGLKGAGGGNAGFRAAELDAEGHGAVGAFPLDVVAKGGDEFGVFAEVSLVGIALEKGWGEGVAAFGIEEVREDFEDFGLGAKNGQSG